MIQSVDSNINKPNYSAVKINIQKPEVNAGDNNFEAIQTENGDFSAVNINIDNPRVNTTPKKIYDYPMAENVVTYDMANINPITLPQGFHVAYQTTNVILPKIENELEIESEKKTVDKDVEVDNEAEIDTKKPIEAPEANYTTVEAENSESPDKIQEDAPKEIAKETPANTNEKKNDAINEDLKIMETETKSIKKPEIIPGEEIKPDVDIPLVISNLNNSDFDIQAQQMEEIARISLDNPDNAIPYIVRDVFSSLIDITKKNSAELAAPTDAQIEARKKVIANYLTAENGKTNNKPIKLPYNISESEFALADEISPMEQAERNKEYALYTMAILAKVYTDEIEKQTGNIVPMTDIPGTSAMVDALRYSPNSGVKIAAIDALRHINRPEYKEEMSTLFTLAEADTNPEVAIAATRALEAINQ